MTELHHKRRLFITILVFFSFTLFYTSTFTSSSANAAETAMDTVSGTVVEIQQNGDRTLVLIKKKKTTKWVAVPSMPVSIGDRVSFQPGVVMTDYHIKGLNRTFSSVVFSPGS